MKLVIAAGMKIGESAIGKETIADNKIPPEIFHAAVNGIYGLVGVSVLVQIKFKQHSGLVVMDGLAKAIVLDQLQELKCVIIMKKKRPVHRNGHLGVNGLLRVFHAAGLWSSENDFVIWTKINTFLA